MSSPLVPYMRQRSTSRLGLASIATLFLVLVVLTIVFASPHGSNVHRHGHSAKFANTRSLATSLSQRSQVLGDSQHVFNLDERDNQLDRCDCHETDIVSEAFSSVPSTSLVPATSAPESLLSVSSTASFVFIASSPATSTTTPSTATSTTSSLQPSVEPTLSSSSTIASEPTLATTSSTSTTLIVSTTATTATSVASTTSSTASAPAPSSTSSSLPIPQLMGKAQVGYFTNWGIYGRNYQVSDIPAQSLSHILYAFANVKPDSGEVFLSDTWSDLEKHYDGDCWEDTGNNAYGNVKQLGKLKVANRHLKVLLSIGGWTYSASFAPMAANAASRANFVKTAVGFVNDLGFDGIDIDWEYPANQQDAANYVALLGEMRQALDAYASSKGESNGYLLTVACPAGPSNYQNMDIAGMDKYLDFWNLMAYDYAGSWDPTAGNQANLYGDSQTQFDTDTAIQYYMSQGVASDKIIMGVPLYGRSFENTTGIGAPYNGIGQGSWEAGVWDYKDLPRGAAQVMTDDKLVASYSYDSSTKELVSFDTPEVVQTKVQYINNKNLGGTMYWELSGDRPISDPQSLVATALNGLQGGLDTRPNHISFPDSKYANIAKGL